MSINAIRVTSVVRKVLKSIAKLDRRREIFIPCMSPHHKVNECMEYNKCMMIFANIVFRLSVTKTHVQMVDRVLHEKLTMIMYVWI